MRYRSSGWYVCDSRRKTDTLAHIARLGADVPARTRAINSSKFRPSPKFAVTSTLLICRCKTARDAGFVDIRVVLSQLPPVFASTGV